jgi:hypothetical protein
MAQYAPCSTLIEKILDNNLPEGDTGLNLVADRIEALIHDGRLLAQGDIKKWRHSELRKPDYVASK